MEHYVGLDVSLKLTAICIVDQTGKIEREGMVPSEPESIAVFIKSHALHIARSGLETGNQMTLPSLLTLEKVKAAILTFARTEDDEFVLHPEHLVTAMPLSEAITLLNRLQALNSFDGDTDCAGRA